MQDMYREEYWRKRGRHRELYPNASSKDASVPPDLPVPNCDCGFPADVFQSRHPDTAARCFYTCSRFNVSNCFHYLFFFICVSMLLIFVGILLCRTMRGAFCFSGSTVQTSLTLGTSFSTIGLEGDIHVSTSSGGFHPLNPPPMMAKEKHLAIVR